MVLAEHPSHDCKTASNYVQEKDHANERGYDLLDVTGDVQVADGDLEILVILEQLNDLEQSQQAVQPRKLCQFQKSDGDKAVAICTSGEDHD